MSVEQSASSFWSGKQVLITGHTGFKGAWLSLWLAHLGARVHGYALPPTTNPDLYDSACIGDTIASTFGDIRDESAVLEYVRRVRADIVFHMAARAIVRESYDDPTGTFATNVMGTVNVLEAVRRTGTAGVVINVTSDKCYENTGAAAHFVENDRLGGADPYSASKACAELAAAAYRQSFFSQIGGARLVCVRAGNVIGGGDWAPDRLVPDCVRAFSSREPVVIRNPNATRPWQHVLDALGGYKRSAEHAWISASPENAYNFGPDPADTRPVIEVVRRITEFWGDGAVFRTGGDSTGKKEARTLALDSSLARTSLGWQPTFPFEIALERTVHWYRSWYAGESAAELCFRDIAEYDRRAALRTRTTSQTEVAGTDGA